MAELVQAQKRAKRNDEVAVRLPGSSIMTSGAGDGILALQEDDDEPRTSNLQAPIMLLTGQEAPVYCFKFSPRGDVAASAGVEKAIYLWDVYGDCQNYNVLRGHQNAVLDLAWLRDGRTLVSAGADKTVMIWDAHKGKRKRKYTSHAAIVNAISAGRADDSIASAADDGQILLWDARARRPARSLASEYAVTSVALDDAGQMLYSGGIDNSIKAWDLRTDEVSYELKGHGDTVTGLKLSPDCSKLLSNGMDHTLRAWDVRPFAAETRELTVFEGHQHDFHKNLLRCAWSHDGEKVACGSSDQVVHVWDVATSEELYYLPGHKGAVTEVDFHPKEPIVGSSSSDMTVYLGEIA